MKIVTEIRQSFLYFSRAARSWVPAASRTLHPPGLQTPATRANQPKTQFDLVSWNVDFASSQPSKRCIGLVNHILDTGVPDILCLLEVRLDVRASLLGHPDIRESFLVTDAEPEPEERRFSTMTLLLKNRFVYGKSTNKADDEAKFAVGPVFRRNLPSATGRDALTTCLIPPYAEDTYLGVINVHLESRDAYSYRAQQLRQVASSLREPGCSGGIIAGDFNATTEQDGGLLEENGLTDAWLSVHGDKDPDAPTWSVGRRRDPRYEPSRLDRIAIMGVVAERMEVVHPAVVGEGSSEIEWSDHSGLCCIFTY